MSSKLVDKSTFEWVQIRKKLYLQIKSEVHRLLASSWKEFIPLEKAYAKELAQKWVQEAKENMFADLKQAELIILGDFHALQQSQRGHLRLLRELPEPSKLVLAVEFFQARHHKVLQQYMKEQISEQVFLDKISWSKTWSFPWENYKPIVDWAKENKIPLAGINWGLEQTQFKSIKTREHFSAICLRRLKLKYPKKKIIVIYGDLHLSNRQLPLSIRKQSCFQKTKILRVFQNNERLYFQALKLGLENQLEVLKLKSGDYCIQSVPPWVKWQSYLLFLEDTLDRQIDELENDVDHTDHVAKLVSFLTAEFKLANKHSTLAVYTANDTHVYAKIRKILPSKEWNVVKRWIGEQRSFYIPELGFGYLGRVTVNHTAILASEYLHSVLSRRRRLYFSGSKDFERQIWIQAMSYLGSKIINHNRKTSSLEELRRSLLNGSAKGANRKILLLALHQKVREIGFLANGKLMSLKSNYGDEFTYVDAARLLGAMLGEKIYIYYRKNRVNVSEMVKLMRLPIEGENFKLKYYKILKIMS